MFHGKVHSRILVMLVLAAGILFARELMSQSSVEEAKLHYKQGVALFKEGNYKMALAEFLKSNELNPNWKLKLNIGICYFNLNRFVQAQDVLTEYIEEGGDQLDEDKKGQAEELLSKISKLLAKVKVDTNVESATVFLDDKEVATTPMSKPMVLESGLYKIRIEAEGYKPYVKDISVAGGDEKVLDITLAKKAGAVEPDEGSKGGETGAGSGEGKIDTGGEKKKKKLSGLAIAAIALAPVALGAFGGVAGAGIQHNNLKSEFEDEGCDPDNLQTTASNYDCKGAYDQIFMLQNVTNAMIAVGAVLAAASLALGITDVVLQKKKKKKAEAFLPRLQTVSLSPLGGDSPGGVLTFSGQW